MALPGAVAVLSVAAALIGPHVLARKPGYPTTMSQELEAAYRRVDITGLKNTGKIVLASDGVRREVIDFTVNGVENPVAQEQGTPDYTTQPITGTLHLPGGGTEPARITTRGELPDSAVGGPLNLGLGPVQEAVDLRPFIGRTPVTETLDVYANNTGVTITNHATWYDAAYYAGSLVIRGKDSRVTAVSLAHNPQLEPVQVHQQPADVVPLRP